MRWFGRMVALQNKLQNPVCYQVPSSRLFCQQRLSEKLVFLLKWNNNLCLFWSLLIKYKIRKSCKKVLEKTGSEGASGSHSVPALFRAEKDVIARGFLLSSENTRTTSNGSLPLSQLLRCSTCSCSSSLGHTPSASHLSVILAFTKINDISQFKSFPQSDREKMSIKMQRSRFPVLSTIKWHL